MTALRTGLVALLIASLASPAFAGDLQASAAQAMAAQAVASAPPASGRSKPLVMTGAALFVTGFTVGAFSLINNQNGKYTEFGEATARNVKVGAAGLGAAFAGGLIMFLGSRARHAPTVTAGAGALSVSKRVSW